MARLHESERQQTFRAHQRIQERAKRGDLRGQGRRDPLKRRISATEGHITSNLRALRSRLFFPGMLLGLPNHFFKCFLAAEDAIHEPEKFPIRKHIIISLPDAKLNPSHARPGVKEWGRTSFAG